jgi:hypothetical protein
MGSRAVLLLKGPSPPKHSILFLLNHKKISPAPSIRRFTTKATANGSSLEPPDVARLAETARISLTPQQVFLFFISTLRLKTYSPVHLMQWVFHILSKFQVEEFGPKIRQVIDWHALLCLFLFPVICLCFETLYVWLFISGLDKFKLLTLTVWNPQSEQVLYNPCMLSKPFYAFA